MAKQPSKPLNSWTEFAALADEFLISYALHLSAGAPAAPRLFVIAHAFELMVKAAKAQRDPSFAINSHEILKHYNSFVNLPAAPCGGRVLDDKILARLANPKIQIDIAAVMEARYRAWQPGQVTLDIPLPGEDPEITDYLAREEIYQAAFYITDIKYRGALHNTMPAHLPVACGLSVGITTTGGMIGATGAWAELFSNLRSFTNWPTLDHHDLIDSTLSSWGWCSEGTAISPGLFPPRIRGLGRGGVRFLELCCNVPWTHSRANPGARSGVQHR